MTRRQQLTEPQISALDDPPTDQRELVRHDALSDSDIAIIDRCCGDPAVVKQVVILEHAPAAVLWTLIARRHVVVYLDAAITGASPLSLRGPA